MRPELQPLQAIDFAGIFFGYNTCLTLECITDLDRLSVDKYDNWCNGRKLRDYLVKTSYKLRNQQWYIE